MISGGDSGVIIIIGVSPILLVSGVMLIKRSALDGGGHGICVERDSRVRTIRSERGATLVEGTIALAFLLLFLFVTLNLLLAAFRSVSLQYVVERGMRQAIIDGAVPDDVMTSIISLARAINVELDHGKTGSSSYVSLCPAAKAPCAGGKIDLGEPDDMLILRINLPLSLLIFNKNRSLLNLGINVAVETRAKHELPM